MVGTSTTRNRVRAGWAAVAVLAVLGTASCGDQQAGGDGATTIPTTSPSDTPAPGTPGAPTPVDATLAVTFDDGGGTTSSWTLTCGVDGTSGGDHPDAVNACAALATATDPFTPVPPDTACTMIYGGPQTATVEGTWDGREVGTTFSRSDGCQVSRWDRVAPLLQPGTTAGSASGYR